MYYVPPTHISADQAAENVPCKPSSARRLPSRRWQACISLMLAAALGLLPTSSRAIDLEFNLLSDTVYPSFDSDASGLMSMFAYAEQFYEDVFEDDTFSVTIGFRYGGTSSLGEYDPNFTTISIHATGDPSGDSRDGTNWFIDPTPYQSEEFDMRQFLWRDLGTVIDGDPVMTKDDAFNDFGPNVPETFEVGYEGLMKEEFRNHSDTADSFDMLSTVMHEIGHALGLSDLAWVETMDGDYDFRPQWINGQSLAVEVASNPPSVPNEDHGNIGHLEFNHTMMTPRRGTLKRRLPSHTDLFAMASALELNDLDVPRREYFGGDWFVDSTWSGNKRPAERDEVFVRYFNATIDDYSAIGALYVSEGSQVAVSNGAKLDLDNAPDDLIPALGDVTVSDANSKLSILNGSEVEARDVTIDQAGKIMLFGGELDARTLTLESNDALVQAAFGTAVINVSETLLNNGEIRATGGSTLNLESSAVRPWVFEDVADADFHAQLTANSGHINFTSGRFLNDNFVGDITLNNGGSITSPAGPWSLLGSLAFYGDGVLDGGSLAVDGNVIVGNAVAEVDAAMTLTPGSTLEIQNGGRLAVRRAFGLDAASAVLDGDLSLFGASSFVNSTISDSSILCFPDCFSAGSLIFRHQSSEFEFVRSNIDDSDITIHAMVIDAHAGTGLTDVAISNSRIHLDRLRVGEHGRGKLLVERGSLIDIDWNGQSGGPVGNGGLRIGSEDQGHGSMIVTGVSDGLRTTVDVYGRISIGDGAYGNTGSLVVADGALVRTDNVISIGNDSLAPGYAGVGNVTVGGTSGGYQAELIAGNWIHLNGSEVAHSTLTIEEGGRVEAVDLVVWNGSTLIQNGGELYLQKLDLTSYGGDFEMSGGTLHVGTLEGDLMPAGGVVAPGNSPGTQMVTGNFAPQAGATLEIELAGVSAGSHFDQLIVGGSAILGGMLNVTLLDGFVPSAGDSFEIISAASVIDEFDAANFPEVAGLLWDLTYHTNSVVVEALASFESDFDFDGDVDGEDLTGPTTGLLARFGNDVGGRDLLRWQRQIGSGPASAASLTAVPEPTTFILLCLGCASLLHASRTRK